MDPAENCVTINADKIEDIFVGYSNFDPFSHQTDSFLNLKELHSHLSSGKRWGVKDLRLRLSNPAQYSEKEISEAIAKWCDRSLVEDKRIADLERPQQIKSLANGFIILVVCLIGSWAVSEGSMFSKHARDFMSEFLFIFAWVGLWPGVERLLHNSLPRGFAKYGYVQIKSLSLILENSRNGST